MRINCVLLYLFTGLIVLLGPVKSDQDPLQDYCVASTENPSKMYVNGVPCIPPQLAEASHFATSALSNPGNTDNQFGINVTITNTMNLPGLNTLGLAMARLDIAPDALVPLHSHPRASEVTILLKVGLIHYLYNMDQDEAALAVSGFSSQNPGLQISSVASFVSTPKIPDEVVEKSFRIHSPDVAKIRRNLGG